MKITLRYFAAIREAIDLSEEAFFVPVGVVTIGDVRKTLLQRGGSWADVLGDHKTVRVAMNQQMTKEDTPLSDGCEVAFFPPVTGG
jgi:molybdopterin synthase sulfur carrier subunit